MTEDTDWLKKNPRMSLWRTSRFFGKDMDASLMDNEHKSKNDALIVTHMPRRSNIPIDKIKQMDFKFPVPISKKSGIKKPVTRVSKFVMPQVVVSRPSVSNRSGETNNGIQKQGLVKLNGRPLALNRPGPANGNSENGLRSKRVQSTPMAGGKFKQRNAKGLADLSTLSQSKVVNQSTPNETVVLRSILKQKRSNEKECVRNLDSKNSTAAKRVIFNGSLNDVSQEKENRDSEAESLCIIKAEGDVDARFPQELEKKEYLKFQPDEVSTVAVFSSCELLPGEDPECKQENREHDENKKNATDEVKKRDGAEKDLKNAGELIDETTKSIFNGKFARCLMDLWKVYHKKVKDIRTELRLVDENFQSTLQLMVNNRLGEKLTAYEEEKRKLFERLKDLELEFREKIKEQTDIKTLFVNYMEKKKNITSMQSELEENFEKTLRMITEKYGENPDFAELEEVVENPPETVSQEKKTMRRVSGTKRKSGCNSGIKRSTPRKRSSWEMKASDGSTPDYTPARRRKLSRKIEKQLRNLFEE